MPESNIVLTGFMGTGKTTVGRQVAAWLGWRFVDLDEVIEARAGKPIGRIFAEDGEPAFRMLESQVCREFWAPASLVIATGGGALLDAGNRRALEAGGTIVCLDADPATLTDRLAGVPSRPLLSPAGSPGQDGAGRRARIADLLAQRAHVYGALDNHVDTGRLSIPAAAERVLGIAAGLPDGGHRLVVCSGRRAPGDPDGASRQDSTLCTYDVLIAEGVLREAGKRLVRAGLAPGRCAVITNPTVAEQLLPDLIRALSDAGFEPLVYQVPDGEAHKTLATAGGLYERLAGDRMARGEPVIALGGGVIGDLAGFVAATWLRGVPFAQIPTSLLGMVDASVGGKVAVDLPQGKNLVGAFKQPVLVLIDPAALRMLPGAEFRSGLAEVLKAGLIGDPALFEALAGPGPSSLTAMIADAVRVKVRIIEDDPYELGPRTWLNLGHTFGHALEVISGYALRHGEAVALGLVAAAELSAMLGYCAKDLPGRVRTAVERLGLPVRYAFDPGQALAAMSTDKKRRGRALRFVLPYRVGEVALVEDVQQAAVLAALETVEVKS